MPTATPAGTWQNGPSNCTNSMTPALTCLDQAAVRTVTEPAQIAVGDVVTFKSHACWDYRFGVGVSEYVRHRVVAVRAGTDAPEYLTQGDANPEPDCWVPFGAVHWVVVDVRKNVYPANKPLFDAVQLVLTAYNEAERAYLDHTEAICGHRDPANCAPPHGADRDHGERLWERTERLKADLECWFTKARRSEYPGHIPATCQDPQTVVRVPRVVKTP